ncbi:superoxide dismutase [Candidatus Nomurabacteria bacterium]|uniref:Superoxide dismutase n=1 Tax=candidate division WWE3 bacterium TaxID=2053526 RepID=A0A955E2F9_UNCKA|nr:superoxide dismutase [candidate division WWE3 bacterium]MCB9823930.1 superoxide dismutase [Candidatus Nomurabacteria bacterium]MCB9827089.1 superoxide dismutase [Candidatus Nomurabacteria bacterium]MCB9827869.1 superoxide dismutase [Candidatus Nomurabacteria bacterium]
MTFELPKLKFSYEDLEPYIDAQTMEIHYTKHHQAYTTNLNASLEKHNELSAKNIEELLQNIASLPEDIRTSVQNNGGGYYNHLLFWESMAPKYAEPSETLIMRVEKDFQTFESFKEQFTQSALTRFGSGWAWLTLTQEGKLKIESTPNQDNPIMTGGKPVLGLDVWEHAYYLKYQNRRAEYIENWWKTVNWKVVEERL